MKPITKKTIIIVTAVLSIAAIVYFVFFRKKGWEKEIDKLNIADSYKEQLKKGVRQILSDPSYNKEETEDTAAYFGITYDQWLIIEAAQDLGWTNGMNDGQLDIRPKN